MTTIAGPRKSHSIHDYPEHLNPFHEDDNHNKIRFWTIGRKLNRSKSITFSGIKDLKNSWAFRSFMKKGKKNQQKETSPTTENGDSSPILYRRALQYSSIRASSTLGAPDRYVYGGSVTPLPRSRFQERLRSPSQHDVESYSATPRMARSEVTGSRLSVGSTNPFDEDDGPVPPVRSRRKKKRAPLPPSAPVADISVTSEKSDLFISETENTFKSNVEEDLETADINFNVELKIVEDGDHNSVHDETNPIKNVKLHENKVESENNNTSEQKDKEIKPDNGIVSKDSFKKIDIITYRRNSSVNEDDIRLRRGNLEDYHELSNKRSKSLTNSLNSSYTTYDINSNEAEKTVQDLNGNEPQKVICKLYDEDQRKQSIDTISSTEREFMEIDKATRELEREISKLNSALQADEDITEAGARLSVSDIKRRFDRNDISSPNPIPKPRRSHYGEPASPINGNGNIE